MVQRMWSGQKVLPLPLLQAVTVYWLGLKVAALFVGFPHADEAYYWLWGQHPALSYFDHAPLQAWLLGLSGALFGWNLFALRFLSILTAGGTLLILYLWSRRLAGESWRQAFWLSAALFYSSPLLQLYTTVALHDRLLVMLALAALHCFAWCFADWAEGRRRYAMLYLGAICVGLATLTKYNGVLLGIGVALAILVRRDLRGLLATPHLYLAALGSVALQAPVLYWNATRDFASAQFHLEHGFEGIEAGVGHIVRMAIETVLLLSPFVVVPMLRFLAGRAGGGFGGMLLSTAKWVFIASSLGIVALAFFRDALFYWNIIAYAAFFGVAAWSFRTRLEQALQLGWGLVVTTALMVQFSIMPFIQSIGLPQPNTDGLFGWEEIAAEVRAAEAETGADFAAAADWQQASRLAFALQDKDVGALSAELDGFDFWFDEEGHRGADAVILMQAHDPRLAYVRSRFERLDKLREFSIERFGRTLFSYELYAGRGYIPEPGPR
ncbi:MAG TPA: phospholipid carrier-dependent glycosyltransferase [Alphaproteobacteria bacterium]|nr:phospholipid carrier-dependent glycosyltransferase [Alphaproteobacteria bacterium]